MIHVWKLHNNKVPNDINMEFYYNKRLGWRTELPRRHRGAKLSAQTIHDASFSVIGAKLWNLLPKNVNTCISLDSFKIQLGNFLSNIPDNHPVTNYTTINNNSILDWASQSGGLRKKLTAL